MSTQISFYNRITDHNPDGQIELDDFLTGIERGKWADLVVPIRTIEDKLQRKLAKEKLPLVTISGSFVGRQRVDLTPDKHSGYIAMDIDGLIDPETAKIAVSEHPSVKAAFISASGNGLCIIFKIDRKRHGQEFDAIATELSTKYNLVVDTACRDLGRMRYASFDPKIYIRKQLTKIYNSPVIKEDKATKGKSKKENEIPFIEAGFNAIIQQIVTDKIDITKGYQKWINIGFAFANQFKEAGRQYYHTISKNSDQYNREATDIQYDACLRSEEAGGDKRVTISTFFGYCKEMGLSSFDTLKLVISKTKGHQKARMSIEQSKETLKNFGGIELSDNEIQNIRQVDISALDKDDRIETIKEFILSNWKMKVNEITEKIEINDVPLTDRMYYTLILDTMSAIGESTNRMTVTDVLASSFIPSYHPIKDVIDANKHRTPVGMIDKMFDCIDTDRPEYAVKFGKKWLVSMIASIYGEHSPLMLVLCGSKQGTGKTEFFRRLLPPELKQYQADSKLDNGKDDDILMTRKLLICDDEMGGKNKKESKRLKEILSRQSQEIRAVYGRVSQDLQRLAVLCGTTNDEEILHDLTGNRRIIPIHVDGIDNQTYNSIDKMDVLIEAYHLYMNDFEYHLSGDDVHELEEKTERFVAYNPLEELLLEHFEQGTHDDMMKPIEVFTLLSEMNPIIMKNQYINYMGRLLAKNKFNAITKKIDDKSSRFWLIKRKTIKARF